MSGSGMDLFGRMRIASALVTVLAMAATFAAAPTPAGQASATAQTVALAEAPAAGQTAAAAKAPASAEAPAAAQVPVYAIVPVASSIKFNVKASVALEGTFEKWEATLTFASADVESGVLEVTIQAGSVNTGSGMKDGKLKGKDFFNVAEDPTITFRSKKIVQTGPTTFEVAGDFTIRGVTKSETLILALTGKGTGNGEVKGTMAFDRKDYGMNSKIPFIRIADRVEVDVDLKATRVSGPPLVYRE